MKTSIKHLHQNQTMKNKGFYGILDLRSVYNAWNVVLVIVELYSPIPISKKTSSWYVIDSHISVPNCSPNALHLFTI